MMEQGKNTNKLLKNSLIYGFGNIINSGMVLVLIPVLTRYLTPEEYGFFSLYKHILHALTILIGVNALGAFAVNYFSLDSVESKRYLFSVLCLITTSFIIISALLFVFHDIVSHFLSFSVKWISLMLLIAFFQQICEGLPCIFQMRNEALSYIMFHISKSGMYFIFVLIFVVFFHFDWSGVVYAALFSTGIVFVFTLLWYKRNKYYQSLSMVYVKDALKFGIPLFPHTLGIWIILSIDKFFVNSNAGLAETGLYSLGSQISSVIAIIALSFNQALFPYIVKELSDPDNADKKKIVRIVYSSFVFYTVIAFVLYQSSNFLIAIVAGESFSGASRYVFWLSLGFAFQGMYLIVANFISVSKKTVLLSISTVSCAILNIVLNIIFIRWNGSIGAAQATMISYVMKFMMTWVMSMHVIKLPWLGNAYPENGEIN